MAETAAPTARCTVVTLGVANMARSIAFYESLGFKRKMRSTGEEVAFFDTGASVLALYPWNKLAADAKLADQPRPTAFRGMTLAWNCSSAAEVVLVLKHALQQGAKLLKGAQQTDYGGYAGYFVDPDEHPWEVVVAPGIEVTADGRVTLPD
jgi:catechol 2,3-dioxygenase-like lactoylglutathione lyase family enzyme